MKLLDKTPEEVVRIQIDDRKNSLSASMTFTETTVEEVVSFVKKISENTNTTIGKCIADKPSNVRVSVFKAVSQKRTGTKTFTVYNITPAEFRESIIKNMK